MSTEQKEIAKLRACIHRLCARGEGLTGWIDNPDAVDALARWEIEKIKATCIATGQSEKADSYIRTAAGYSA